MCLAQNNDFFVAKMKYSKDFGIYICICQFFFVTLRVDLCACINVEYDLDYNL